MWNEVNFEQIQTSRNNSPSQWRTLIELKALIRAVSPLASAMPIHIYHVLISQVPFKALPTSRAYSLQGFSIPVQSQVTYHFDGQLDIVFTHIGVVVLGLRVELGLQNGRSSTAGCRLD